MSPTIDHLVILVEDLGEAARQAEEKGFTVTPRSAHTRLGSANHCLMFPRGDYLEFMGFVEATEHLGDLRQRLARHGPGPAALALVTEDVEETFDRLRTAGVEPEPPLDFGRPVTLPNGEDVEVNFRIVRIPPAHNPGLPLFFCQHLSRAQVWHPGWLQHPNGVRGLAEIHGTVPTKGELKRLTAFYGIVFGSDTSEAEEGVLRIQPPGGAVLEWRVNTATEAALVTRVGLLQGPADEGPTAELSLP